MSIYVYPPVNSLGGEIRLLKVHSDPDILLGWHRPPLSKIVPLRGSICQAYLPSFSPDGVTRALRQAQLPLYRALSYVWGSSERTHEIWIDGHPIPITANLFEALRAIQEQARVDTYIWADAICINQEDATERSEQVQLMRTIYHDAIHVHIWLGRATVDTLRIVRFIKLLYKADSELTRDETRFSEAARSARLAPGQASQNIRKAIVLPILMPLLALKRMAEPIQSSGRIVRERLLGVHIYGDDDSGLVPESDVHLSLQNDVIKKYIVWRPTPASLLALDEEGDYQEIAALLNELLNHDWFNRIWCVQEAGAARSDTRVRIGSHSIDWSQTIHCVYYLNHIRNIPIPNVRKLVGLEKIHLGYSLGKRQSLQVLMREFRYKRATDSRDKVFALLGLMGDQMNPYLQADYTKSVAEVYANATLHFITRNESLDPICDQQFAGRSRGLPTWVPDYTLNGSCAASTLTSIETYPRLFCASGDDCKFVPPADLCNAAQTKILPTLGHFIDVVDSLSPCHADNATVEEMERTLSSAIINTALIEQVSRIVGQYGAYRNPLLKSETSQILSLTLEALFDPVVQAYIHTLFCGIISPHERLSLQMMQEIFVSSITEGQNESTLPTARREEFISKVCHGLEAGMRRRRLAVTQCKLLAAVPEHAHPDDLICVLRGCSVPVLLRSNPKSEAWELVGACYMYGLMDGERATDDSDMPFLII